MAQNIFKRVKIVRYLEATLQGGARSQIMASEEGIHYIIKFKENKQGIRVLVNELVANGIAHFLQLPCPEGIIAEIDDEFLRVSNIGQIDGMQISAGLHFGTLEIKNIYRKPPRTLISQAGNKDIFPGIILFDILTLNSNRNNEGNYLIIQSGQDNFDFCIIDHGHCFGSPDWDTSIVNKIGTWNYNVLPEVAHSIEGSDPFRSYIEKIKTLSNEFISGIIAEVPEEWKITLSEREALKTFLIGQREKIEEIILKNRNLFPKWKLEEAIKWIEKPAIIP